MRIYNVLNGVNKRLALKSEPSQPFVDSTAVIALDLNSSRVNRDGMTVANLRHLFSKGGEITANTTDLSETAGSPIAVVGIHWHCFCFLSAEDSERKVIDVSKRR